MDAALTQPDEDGSCKKARSAGATVNWRAVAAVSILFLAMLAAFWDGVGPMDSMKYIAAALNWREYGPALGEDQWALRAPLVASIATAYALFGASELTSTLPNILFSAALVVVTYHFGRRHIGPSAGFFAAALVATSPYFLVMQTQVWIAGPEILATALACWLFLDMYGGAPDARRLFLIGLLSGAAWLCRETAAFLPACIGLLALVRWPRKIGALAALSAGFLIVVGVEMLIYQSVAGDAFHRYRIDLGHRGEGEFYEAYSAAGEALTIWQRLLQPFGHMLSRPAITPFLLLAAIALAAPWTRRALASPPLRRPAIVFGVCAVVGFASASYGAALRSPVYYPIMIYAALLVLAVCISGAYESGRRRIAGAMLAALVAVGAFAADFRNYGEQVEARYLADRVAETGETVVTDPHTSFRTRIFLRFRGFSAEVAAARVRTAKDAGGRYCGIVFAGTPKGLYRAIDPEPDWRVIWSEPVREPRLTHRFLLALGADKLHLARVRDILVGAKPPILFEAPPCG